MRVVCLLRGINVGRSVRLPMADLRAIAASCGYGDPRTHLQSGNLVIDVDEQSTGDEYLATTVASELESAITAATPLTPAVIVRTADEVHELITANPFTTTGSVDDPTKVHVTFAREPVGGVALDPDDFHPEAFALHGRDLYLHLPGGMGRSRLAVALDKDHRRARRVVTTRNWRTVLALAELLDR